MVSLDTQHQKYTRIIHLVKPACDPGYVASGPDAHFMYETHDVLMFHNGPDAHFMYEIHEILMFHNGSDAHFK